MKESSYTPAPVIGDRVKNFIVLGISNILAVFSACSFQVSHPTLFLLFGMEEQPEFVSSNTFAGTLWFRYLFSFVVVLFLFSLISSFSSLLLS